MNVITETNNDIHQNKNTFTLTQTYTLISDIYQLGARKAMRYLHITPNKSS